MDPEPFSSNILILQFLFLGFLLFLSSVFSASETALTSISKAKLKELIEKGKKKEKIRILTDALHKPNKLLTTILFFNNFINILASTLATLLVYSLFKGDNMGLVTAIATGIMTILILIFGEITPKIYSVQHTERVFRLTIGVISVLSVIIAPIVWFLVFISNIIIKIMRSKKVSDTPFITEDEIIYAMHLGAQEGAIEPEEKKMLTRALELKDTTVREIMVPRVDMLTLEENDLLEEAVQLVKEEGYSRFPVFRESIDNVIGILYAKDILKVIHERGPEILSRMKVKEIIRIPIFVPETKKIDDLLHEFKTDMVHMAIVVDEYGGTEGVVTIEDIIEEVMGEIMDEFDEGEQFGIEKIKENTYIVDSKVTINDLERELDIIFPDTDFESLGGYLLEVFERVPRVGEEIDVNGFHFRILAASKNRIEKIKVTVKLLKLSPESKKAGEHNGSNR